MLLVMVMVQVVQIGLMQTTAGTHRRTAEEEIMVSRVTLCYPVLIQTTVEVNATTCRTTTRGTARYSVSVSCR